MRLIFLSAPHIWDRNVRESAMLKSDEIVVGVVDVITVPNDGDGGEALLLDSGEEEDDSSDKFCILLVEALLQKGNCWALIQNGVAGIN